MGVRGSLSGTGRAMKLTTVFHLVQKLRIRDAILPLPLRVHGEVFKKSTI